MLTGHVDGVDMTAFVCVFPVRRIAAGFRMWQNVAKPLLRIPRGSHRTGSVHLRTKTFVFGWQIFPFWVHAEDNFVSTCLHACASVAMVAPGLTSWQICNLPQVIFLHMPFLNKKMHLFLQRNYRGRKGSRIDIWIQPRSYCCWTVVFPPRRAKTWQLGLLLALSMGRFPFEVKYELWTSQVELWSSLIKLFALLLKYIMSSVLSFILLRNSSQPGCFRNSHFF